MSKIDLYTEFQKSAIRRASGKIISSPLFSRAHRLQELLDYVVGKELLATGEQLKEYSIGVDVFGRDPSFTPAEDNIVRVEAGRLRHRLQQYYRQAGEQDTVTIGIPLGSYRPLFTLRDASREKVFHGYTFLVEIADFTVVSDGRETSDEFRELEETIEVALANLSQGQVQPTHDVRPENDAGTKEVGEGAVFRIDGVTIGYDCCPRVLLVSATHLRKDNCVWSGTYDRDTLGKEETSKRIVEDALNAFGFHRNGA